jgi:hypothetical protein
MTKFFGRSTKTLKGDAWGWRTAISYLLPGERECPWATAGCKAVCLGLTSGRMVMSTVRKAQRVRTERLRELLATGGVAQAAAAYVADLGVRPRRLAVRVNGTSDLPGLADAVHAEMARLGWTDVGARCYDYTKSVRAALAWCKGASQVHRTFSLSEDNLPDAKRVIEAGGNVAAVCDAGGMARLIAELLPCVVVDGDVHDLRFLDPDRRTLGRGCLVVLSPKGAARRDTSGFVWRALQAV